MKLDALYKIFEDHINNFNDETETEVAFIRKVVDDYILFLTAHGSIVSRRNRPLIADELTEQVREMLIKKMYGCLSLTEYVHSNQNKKQRNRSWLNGVKKAK